MATAIAKINRDDGRCPMEDEKFVNRYGKRILQCKFNVNVQKLLKKHNINHSTYSIMKASVIERFNRTLKNMWKQFTHNGNYKRLATASRV